MAATQSIRALGWGFAFVGVLVLATGGLMVWQARLHNSIVASAVDSPWPGYVLVGLGVVAVAAGAALMRRSKRS